jgi:hypothetical protein
MACFHVCFEVLSFEELEFLYIYFYMSCHTRQRCRCVDVALHSKNLAKKLPYISYIFLFIIYIYIRSCYWGTYNIVRLWKNKRERYHREHALKQRYSTCIKGTSILYTMMYAWGFFFFLAVLCNIPPLMFYI